MAILIILIIALILYAVYKAPERQAHHYLPPEGMEIDWTPATAIISSQYWAR